MSLVVEGLSHRFGSQQALSGVSLRVDAGDCYGFIGHNGAGKTTAMRAILGLLRPDGGRVVVDGFDAAEHVREARARMGGLIETPGFHGHWSGRRNLRLLDRLAGGSSDVDALLELVGLGGVGRKPVRAYSQGMRQRLGVAQALLGDPDYVLLDEPTNGLDPDGIREMRELIVRLTREEGRTVFLSSHQLHELAGVCNRVGVLRQGRLVLEGTLDELLVTDRYVLKTPDEERIIPIGGRNPADVLREFVDREIEVVSFAPQAPSLEEIYHASRVQDAAPPVVEPVETGPPAERAARPGPLPRMLAHEFRRWFGQWTAPLMLLLPSVAAIVAVLQRSGGAAAHEEEVSAGVVATTTAVNAYEGTATGLRIGVWMLCYVVAALASQSVAGEMAHGTLRNVLLRPLTRLQVALGKGLAVVLAAFVAYAVLAAVSVGVAAAAFDFTGVVEILPNGKRFPLLAEEEIRPDFWVALLSPLLPLAAFAGMGFLAGSLGRRGATALAAGLGLCVLLEMARDPLGPGVASWLPGAYAPGFPAGSLPSFGDSSFIAHFLEVSRGFANTTYGLAESVIVFGVDLRIPWDILVPLVWIVSTFSLSTLLLRRRYVP